MSPEIHLLPLSTIQVLIKRSEKRRRWSLSVSPGGEVTLSVPAKLPAEKIAFLIKQHEEWIYKRHAKLSKFPRIDLSQGWSEGQDFYFQGKNLKLELRRSHYPHVALHEEKLLVAAPDFRATIIKKTVENWLEENTFREAGVFLLKWAPRFELKTNPPLKLRVLKRSWGQCRSDGRITLHKFLSRLHPEFFEYVLVHEVCHLFHMNHGAGFKTLLGEMLPHWKEIKKKYEPILF